MMIGIIFGLMLAVVLVLVLLPLMKSAGTGDKNKALPYAIGAIVIAASAGVYFMVGSPDLLNPPKAPDMEGDSQPDQAQLPSVSDMIDRIYARLEEDPENVEAWSFLGQSLMVMGRYDEAADAYQKAIDLAPGIAELYSALGESLLLAADGVVTPAAVNAFDRALVLDPGDPIARYYIADYMYQQGDSKGAYDRWMALFNEVPAETPWLSLLDERIRAAAADLGIEAPAVLDEKMAAAEAAQDQQFDPGQMNEEDQQAMIEGMVAQLAARLADDPSDMDGWMQLGRSYMVLKRPEDAAAAYLNVVAVRPDDAVALSAYVQALLTIMEDRGEQVSDYIVQNLKQLDSLDPNNTTALYYLGVAALQADNAAEAKGYWQRLLALLPEDSMDAAFVKKRIEEIG